MSASFRLVGRFAFVFVVALAILVAAWAFVAPRYGAAVSAIAQPAFRWVERDDVTILSAQDDAVWAYRRVGQDRVAPFMFFDRYAFFAIVPLLALFAATPGLRAGRAWRALCGTCLLFMVHVSYVVASVELSYAAAGFAAGGPHTIAQWIVRLVWEAAPIVIWLAFTAGAWTRSLRAVRAIGDGGRVQRAEHVAGMRRVIAWTPREGRVE